MIALRVVYIPSVFNVGRKNLVLKNRKFKFTNVRSEIEKRNKSILCKKNKAPFVGSEGWRSRGQCGHTKAYSNAFFKVVITNLR